MPNRLRTLPVALFAGANVALATLASAVAAVLGQPGVAWPICGMVGAVYGVSTLIGSIGKSGASR
jgi:hypothetical protein